MKKLTLIIATGFGLGLSPIASGTAGSILGIAIVYAISIAGCSVLIHSLICLALIIICVPVCDIAEDHFGRIDDGRIVADEYLTFPICMIGLPFNWTTVLICFLSARFFDIIKLPPARQFEKLHGGFGITMDDVAASIYSLAANHLIIKYILPWLGEKIF